MATYLPASACTPTPARSAAQRTACPALPCPFPAPPLPLFARPNAQLTAVPPSCPITNPTNQASKPMSLPSRSHPSPPSPRGGPETSLASRAHPRNLLTSPAQPTHRTSTTRRAPHQQQHSPSGTLAGGRAAAVAAGGDGGWELGARDLSVGAKGVRAGDVFVCVVRVE